MSTELARGLVVAVAADGPEIVVTVHLNAGGTRRVKYAREAWRAVVNERGGSDCILGRPAIVEGDRLSFPDPELRFEFGRLLATPGALAALTRNSAGVWAYLSRHLTGDWGDLEPADKAENELSLREGFRLLSAYALPDGARLWIITEADRSATTLLLPDEY
jgi:hypothetical protein